MGELFQEMMRKAPEGCRDCQPLLLLARLLVSKEMAGSIDRAEVEDIFQALLDTGCAGAPERGVTCGTPACAHKKGEMYLPGKTAVIATRGLQSLEL